MRALKVPLSHHVVIVAHPPTRSTVVTLATLDIAVEHDVTGKTTDRAGATRTQHRADRVPLGKTDVPASVPAPPLPAPLAVAVALVPLASCPPSLYRTSSYLLEYLNEP